MLAPEAASPSRRALPWRAFAKHDPSLGEVVRSHLHMYPVADDRADAVFAHLARRIGDDPVLVVERDAETSVGHDLVDQPFHREECFLCQTGPSASMDCPRRGRSAKR